MNNTDSVNYVFVTMSVSYVRPTNLELGFSVMGGCFRCVAEYDRQHRTHFHQSVG